MWQMLYKMLFRRRKVCFGVGNSNPKSLGSYSETEKAQRIRWLPKKMAAVLDTHGECNTSAWLKLTLGDDWLRGCTRKDFDITSTPCSSTGRRRICFQRSKQQLGQCCHSRGVGERSDMVNLSSTRKHKETIVLLTPKKENLLGHNNCLRGKQLLSIFLIIQ